MISRAFRCLTSALCAAAFCFSLHSATAQTAPPAPAAATPNPAGTTVNFQLPTDGPLPKTYRVTLAATDPKNPDWIISTFAAGMVCTVTDANKGKFTATWDGLDDNYMPVPAGTWGLKGIYMPAEKWGIDGEYHTIVPKLAAMGSSWAQSPSEDTLPRKVEGDPVGGPLRDIDVAPNGRGSVLFQYLENGKNYFLTDFTKPPGYSQIITGYPSGVFAGGSSTCTDGEKIWSFSTDGGPKFVGRADGQPFGHQNANRHNVFLPEGWVKALAAWPDKTTGQTLVFVAEAGRIEAGIDEHRKKAGAPAKPRYTESTTDFVDEVLALDGNDAHVLATWKIAQPLGLAARNGTLYILHGGDKGYEVLSLPLTGNWATQQPALLFKVKDGITPFDIEVDSHGRIYLSDSNANHVYQCNASGQVLRTYGKLDAQKGGEYDPETFMAPEKLATWTDDKGQDRLLVVEQAGPNRLSEWSAEDGKMIRQWVVPQTRANDGYAVDPKHPDEVYLPGQQNTLVRWKVDYTTGTWTPEAVWTNVGSSHGGDGSEFGDLLLQPLASPRLVYRGNDVYLAFWRGYVIYHLEGDHWRACSGIFTQTDADKKRHYYLWRDLNADGKVQPEEYLPFETDKPLGTLRYFGETYSDDLTLECIGQNTSDIWSLPPATFDNHGTPIFDPKGWQKVLTDDVFEAKKAKTAIATRGGNEVGGSFDSSWASVTRAGGDYYVSARSGPNLSANNGTQYKLSRYVPDGKGGYRQIWRVGRISFQGVAKPGEVYGPIFVSPPVNGLVGLVDNSRAGFVLYTEDGMYVDTLFADSRIIGHDQAGVYTQPGEYFTGYDYPNKDNGKVYLALGKLMPEIFETKGWTTTENPVKPLTTLDKDVKLAVNQIASPAEMVLQIRGGAAASRVARFYPAPGGSPALDGSLRGWEACDPVQFSSGDAQTIEARCYYDPDHLYIRWHARLGHPFAAKALQPFQHVFAHDRGNDTLGLYLQGDANAAPGSSKKDGRPGDVRFIFGIFQDGGRTAPAVVGMYPSWQAPGGSAQTYTTPVGSVTFANVDIAPGVTSGYQIDPDGKGFVLAAAIPRAAIPGAPKLDDWHTLGNFDANLGGLDRFWWSNADGSASRETYDEPTESRLYPGSWSPVQFLPISPLTIHSWMAIGPFGFAGVEKLDHLADRPQIVKTLRATIFPPDTTRDMKAVYQVQTRFASHKLIWKDEEISTDLVDMAEVLGWKAGEDEGAVYLMTHIYSPEAASVTLELNRPHGQPYFSAQLNGKPLPTVPEKGSVILDSSKPLTLQPGWNELLVRYDRIWGDLHMGAKLTADPAVLWKLQISGPPPVNVISEIKKLPDAVH